MASEWSGVVYAKKKKREEERNKRRRRRRHGLYPLSVDKPSFDVFHHAVNELVKRAVVLAVQQPELCTEEHKVLERCVEVGLQSQLAELVKVVAVEVRIHTEETFEDGLRQ